MRTCLLVVMFAGAAMGQSVQTRWGDEIAASVQKSIPEACSPCEAGAYCCDSPVPYGGGTTCLCGGSVILSAEGVTSWLVQPGDTITWTYTHTLDTASAQSDPVAVSFSISVGGVEQATASGEIPSLCSGESGSVSATYTVPEGTASGTLIVATVDANWIESGAACGMAAGLSLPATVTAVNPDVNGDGLVNAADLQVVKSFLHQ